MSYNGWSNYETWVTKLWMDNDAGSYEYWQEVTEDVCSTAESAEECQDNIGELADRIKDEHEANTPETVGVYSDLLTAALGEVDWYEIAQSLIQDYIDSNNSQFSKAEEDADYAN